MFEINSAMEKQAVYTDLLLEDKSPVHLVNLQRSLNITHKRIDITNGGLICEQSKIAQKIWPSNENKTGIKNRKRKKVVRKRWNNENENTVQVRISKP